MEYLLVATCGFLEANWQDSLTPHNLLAYNSIRLGIPDSCLLHNTAQHSACGQKGKPSESVCESPDKQELPPK